MSREYRESNAKRLRSKDLECKQHLVNSHILLVTDKTDMCFTNIYNASTHHYSINSKVYLNGVNTWKFSSECIWDVRMVKVTQHDNINEKSRMVLDVRHPLR